MCKKRVSTLHDRVSIRTTTQHYSANAQDVDTSLAWMRVKGSVNEHHIEHVTLCRTKNC